MAEVKSPKAPSGGASPAVGGTVSPPANATQTNGNASKSTSPLEKARAARKAPPADETKAQKFKRLANRRVPAAISKLNNVTSLFNKNQYEWTDEQMEKINKALNEALAALWRRQKGSQEVASSWSL